MVRRRANVPDENTQVKYCEVPGCDNTVVKPWWYELEFICHECYMRSMKDGNA